MVAVSKQNRLQFQILNFSQQELINFVFLFLDYFLVWVQPLPLKCVRNVLNYFKITRIWYVCLLMNKTEKLFKTFPSEPDFTRVFVSTFEAISFT